ncbi:MAG: sterol desaturase family protein [Pseudomonadota bacterium]
METATQFVVVTLAFWALLLTIYFGFGTLAERITARFPERKIQPNRDGLRRKQADIRVSVKKLAVSAALIGAGYTAREAGWTLEPAPLTWWSAVLWFAAGMIVFDFWFYVTHRMLHWRPLYRFHALHHRNVAPTVWSNDCTGTVDTIMEHSFYLAIWFMMPIPTAVVFAIRIFNQFVGMIGHAGFEFFASPATRAPWPFVGSTYHDLHHMTSRYNFANTFSIWDRLFGTTHPDYDARIAWRSGSSVEEPRPQSTPTRRSAL